MRQLVQQLATKYNTGIHPSWQSGDDEGLLAGEINCLEQLSGQPVTRSRQHYIRMQLPGTYRRLLEHGITDDYSMGYGSINGFRASTCSPHYWYDLEADCATSLQLHPFCYMDANSYFEQRDTPVKAAQELQHYHDVVRAVNGTLVTIFHNHFLTETPPWQDWRSMYAAFLEKYFG